MPECPNPRCEKFADYLVDNYVTVDSKFPPKRWACAPSEDKRTHNGTESFHAHFNDVLRKVQAATYIKMRSIDNQAPIRRIEKDKICFLMEQYGKFQENEISRYDFIKIVGYKFSARTDL